MNVTKVGISTDDACDLTGATRRQLDYWERTDLVRPSVKAATGSGTQHGWSVEDLQRIGLVLALKDLGFELSAIRRAFATGDVGAWLDQAVAGLMDLTTGPGKIV